jgi:hypothetical protein
MSQAQRLKKHVIAETSGAMTTQLWRKKWRISELE